VLTGEALEPTLQPSSSMPARGGSWSAADLVPVRGRSGHAANPRRQVAGKGERRCVS